MSELAPASVRRLRSLAISDAGFVFDPRTGHSYSANATALCALDALKRDVPSSEIAALLRERFAADDVEVEHDLAEFIRALGEHGLVQSDPGGGSNGSGGN
ncbi:MAG: PqqD family protein [Planctomycetes bacterium]|nr:PqqD family protein [Planctomycetota bacterium]